MFLPIPPVNHAGVLRAFPSSHDLLPGQSDPPPHPSLSSCPPAAAPPLDLSSTRGAECRWATQWTSRSFALRLPDPPGSCWEKRREVVRAPPVGAIARGRASSSPGERRRGLLGVCSPTGSADRERPGRAGIVVVIVQPQGSTLLLLLGGRCVQGKPTRRGTDRMRRAADPHQGKRHTRPARVPMPASRRRTKLHSLHQVATSSSTCSMICVNRGPRPCRPYDYTSLPPSNP
jgi:hypothetical protein